MIFIHWMMNLWLLSNLFMRSFFSLNGSVHLVTNTVARRARTITTLQAFSPTRHVPFLSVLTGLCVFATGFADIPVPFAGREQCMRDNRCHEWYP
jgi:hypothetical protein